MPKIEITNHKCQFNFKTTESFWSNLNFMQIQPVNGPDLHRTLNGPVVFVAGGNDVIYFCLKVVHL